MNKLPTPLARHSLTKIIDAAIKFAPERKELWYISALADLPGGMIHIDADAYTTFEEQGLRRAHIGLHSNFNIGLWEEATKSFSVTAMRYANSGSIDSRICVDHPETNSGLTVETKPADWLYLPSLSFIQVNQLDSGHTTHAGHWRSGATIVKVPPSAIGFVQEVLSRLGVSHKIRGDKVQAKYLQSPTTTFEHLLDVYSWAFSAGRPVDVHFNLLEDSKKHVVYRGHGSVALKWSPKGSYFGLSFGKTGSSSWDTNIPQLRQEEIAFMESVLSYMTHADYLGLNWKVDHYCTGRDRGENDYVRKSRFEGFRLARAILKNR